VHRLGIRPPTLVFGGFSGADSKLHRQDKSPGRVSAGQGLILSGRPDLNRRPLVTDRNRYGLVVTSQEEPLSCTNTKIRWSSLVTDCRPFAWVLGGKRGHVLPEVQEEEQTAPALSGRCGGKAPCGRDGTNDGLPSQVLIVTVKPSAHWFRKRPRWIDLHPSGRPKPLAHPDPHKARAS
jgi:hypothetical protein